MLKEGQLIKDGESNLIICSVKEYDGFIYAYVLNDKTNEVGFYKVNVENGIYDFELEEDKKQVEELILVFAKDYVSKNPQAIEDLEKLINPNSEED